MAKKYRIALFSVLSVLVTCFIFSNSLPGIDESSAQSSMVAEFLRPFLDPKHRLSDEMFHHIVRKLAHFIEFGALGVSLSGLSIQYVRSFSKTWGTPFVLSVLIALVCGVTGLALSYYLNTSAGAAVVLCCAAVYFVTLPLRRK